jgi:hypothetical protein
VEFGFRTSETATSNTCSVVSTLSVIYLLSRVRYEGLALCLQYEFISFVRVPLYSAIISLNNFSRLMSVKEQSIILEAKLELVRFVDQLHAKTNGKVKMTIFSEDLIERTNKIQPCSIIYYSNVS